MAIVQVILFTIFQDIHCQVNTKKNKKKNQDWRRSGGDEIMEFDFTFWR